MYWPSNEETDAAYTAWWVHRFPLDTLPQKDIRTIYREGMRAALIAAHEHRQKEGE